MWLCQTVRLEACLCRIKNSNKHNKSLMYGVLYPSIPMHCFLVNASLANIAETGELAPLTADLDEPNHNFIHVTSEWKRA